MIRARRRLFPLFCFAFATLAAGCLEIEVDPDLMPRIPAIPDPGPEAPRVHLWLHGDRMDDASWAKALTISRFFFSGIENSSGSPRELLEPGIREALRQRGYRVAKDLFVSGDAETFAARRSLTGEQADSGGDLILEVFAERNQLLWLPPREFIQTPRARARGTVRVDLAIRSRLYRLAGSPEAILWSDAFQEQEELRVLPGEEGVGLATGAAQAFQNYLRRLQIDLPAPKSL